MSLDVEHHGEHAVVTFSGELTIPAVLELVGLIDGIVTNYFYPRIELLISSPGGIVEAANPFFSALPRWRARGTVLCTRVYTHAASLAAILFSVGDERLIDPHARLLFHAARIAEATRITALDTLGMHAALRQLDDRLVHHLVDRALRSSEVTLPALAHPTDKALVSALARELSLGGRARKSHAARVRALARHVERAVHNRDRAALDRLYRIVLREEVSISSHLACTLCLADRVAEPEPASVDCEAEREPVAATLPVPEWRTLYPPRGDVPCAALTRHTLILGATGSGKTLSGVLAIGAAMARAPRAQVAGGLIIDPKRELAPVVRALAGDSLQLLEPDTLVLNLMDHPRWRLDEDLAAKRWVSAATTILLRMRGFAIASPLRVLGPHAPDTANSEFFDREGCALLRDVVAFVLMLLDADAPSVSEWLSSDDPGADPCDAAEGERSEASSNLAVVIERKGPPPATPPDPREWVQALHARAQGADGERGLNVVALAAWALGTPLVQSRDEDTPWLWEQLARAALPVFGAEPGEARDVLERIVGYWRKSAEVERQHMGVVASARSASHEFAAPSVERTLHFGCEPGLAATGTSIDFARLVACGSPDPTGPRFVLYQPARDGADSLAAASLKARFFESVFADEDRQSGRTDLPLVGYVADEAHRYITSDAVHGEQSFLDSARSFGCLAVLATQSMASIEHALAQGGGTSVQRSAAMAIVATNTGTKLVFRTTDESTSEMVQTLTPYRPGYAPVTRVRPLSALATGACYAFLPDGRFQLAQLAPFDPDTPGLEPSSVVDSDSEVHGPAKAHRRRRRRRRARRSGSSRTVTARVRRTPEGRPS